jgi:hypothetical protein
MTRRARAQASPEIVLQIGPIPKADLDACARALARLAVEKALWRLGLRPLDSGPTFDEDPGNQHEAAPPGGDTPNGAKEQVI